MRKRWRMHSQCAAAEVRASRRGVLHAGGPLMRRGPRAYVEVSSVHRRLADRAVIWAHKPTAAPSAITTASPTSTPAATPTPAATVMVAVAKTACVGVYGSRGCGTGEHGQQGRPRESMRHCSAAARVCVCARRSITGWPVCASTGKGQECVCGGCTRPLSCKLNLQGRNTFEACDRDARRPSPRTCLIAARHGRRGAVPPGHVRAGKK